MLQICRFLNYVKDIKERRGKKMKNIYEIPNLEILIFMNKDVVTSSNGEMEYDPNNPSGEGGTTGW